MSVLAVVCRLRDVLVGWVVIENCWSCIGTVVCGLGGLIFDSHEGNSVGRVVQELLLRFSSALCHNFGRNS